MVLEVHSGAKRMNALLSQLLASGGSTHAQRVTACSDSGNYADLYGQVRLRALCPTDAPQISAKPEIAMEPLLPVHNPGNVKGSAQSAVFDSLQMHSTKATEAECDGVPVKSRPISVMETPHGENHTSYNNNSPERRLNTQAEPPFRLGIESGRRFFGSSGDIYELLDAIGSGSASTVYKCKLVKANLNSSKAPDRPFRADTLCTATAEEVFAVKAIDLKGLSWRSSSWLCSENESTDSSVSPATASTAAAAFAALHTSATALTARVSRHVSSCAEIAKRALGAAAWGPHGWEEDSANEEGGEEAGRGGSRCRGVGLGSGIEAVDELFAQVRGWICEMQKQGERLGMRYERAEASVSELICCVLTALSASAPSSVPRKEQTEANEQAEQILSAERDATTIETPLVEAESEPLQPAEVRQHPSVSGISLPSEHESGEQRSTLVTPVCAALEAGSAKTKGTGFFETEVGVWGPSGSGARMDLLREFLGSKLRRMLYSFMQHPTENDASGATDTEAGAHLAERGGEARAGGREESKQVATGIREWSQVGAPDPSLVTEEILDFLFLSTKTAASHARQLRQPSKDSGEGLGLGGALGAPMGGVFQEQSLLHGEVLHSESAPGEIAGSAEVARESPRSADGEASRGGREHEVHQCAELSFLCEPGFSTASAGGALQAKIAVSRLQLKSLEKLRQFRTQCKVYLELSNARNAKLMDLGLHVQLRADQLDAIRALRAMPDE
ncbi:uncharacterized protein LOC34619969 [Cyclospora cayetanensis]|uniref:Uncharacterized protein LOC34619969 n=1 Tax=Cyclospora cayetanensis TaxID=88456 RepID=A0A6P6RS96_9EIME|nr:uncharacterized protein LOC34619969 [Cyclospora cayetanensis]